MILSSTTLFISWIFLWVLISPYTLQFCGISLKMFKEFGTFWPCYFISPSGKSTNNLWKVHGLIDVFNESRRQIASGVEKAEYESMRAIQFCTTPKRDLPC